MDGVPWEVEEGEEEESRGEACVEVLQVHQGVQGGRLASRVRQEKEKGEIKLYKQRLGVHERTL